MSNYKIVQDKGQLDHFIATILPDLQSNEKFYITLLARKKYFSPLKSDKGQLKRILATKELIYNKLRQLECPIGSYESDGIEVPQEALAAYIHVNPRNLERATANSLKKFVDLVVRPYNGYNPLAHVLSEIQRANSRKVWMNFDVDHANIEKVLDIMPDILNKEAYEVIATRGGCHILVKTAAIQPEYSKDWFQKIKKSKLVEEDSHIDDMIPIPGCCQGGFVPYIVP